jgi:hypothetical protein
MRPYGALKCRERRPSGRLLKTAKQTLGVPRLGVSPKTFVEKKRKGLNMPKHKQAAGKLEETPCFSAGIAFSNKISQAIHEKSR